MTEDELIEQLEHLFKSTLSLATIKLRVKELIKLRRIERLRVSEALKTFIK